MHRETAALLATAGWTDLQDRLVRGLCHDFNGRLTSLYAVSQLAGGDESQPPAFGAELERLETLVSRLADLVGDLVVEPAPFAFRELLDRAIRHIRPIDPGGEAEVRERLSGDLPAVLVNEGRCLRALLLFVEWAIGACPAGATCLIDVEGSQAGVVMRFPSDQKHIDQAVMSALDRVVAMDGGSVSVEGGHCTLRLPSLARARAALR